jgi:hypothetical protein
VVDGARLESVYRGDSIVGSNPTVSATPSAVSGNCRELPANRRSSASFGDPHGTKRTLWKIKMGPNILIFSAAIFRGRVGGLGGGAESSERPLVIPAHWQFAR